MVLDGKHNHLFSHIALRCTKQQFLFFLPFLFPSFCAGSDNIALSQLRNFRPKYFQEILSCLKFLGSLRLTLHHHPSLSFVIIIIIIVIIDIIIIITIVIVIILLSALWEA